MIKFFRKIRQKLLSENKFSKYLIYAVGEIILVVIGILIALQINNWNEKRKANEDFILLLSNVRDELVYNIEKSSEVIDYYRNVDTLANKVLNNRLVKDDYKNNPTLFNISYNYAPVDISRDAFNSLLENNNNLSPQEKSIIGDLKMIYNDYFKTIQRLSLEVEELSLKFTNELRLEKDWAYLESNAKSINDLVENEAIMGYYLDSPFYLNNLSTFRLVSLYNLTSMLISTRTKLLDSYTTISEYLDLEKDTSVINDPIKFKSYFGTYRNNEGWTIRIYEENNQILVSVGNAKDSITAKPYNIYFEDKTQLTIDYEYETRFGELKFDINQNVNNLHIYFGNRKSNYKKIE
jgi:hypothetical protein